ncbi:hypothetical protein [Mediterraneibacter faecis]
MMDDREISVWHHGVFGRYRPRKNNFPECAWSNRRRRKRTSDLDVHKTL